MRTLFIRSISLALVAASVSLAGCSALNTGSTSEFSCDRSNECPTPLEVYQDTHSTPTAVNLGRTPGNWKAGSKRGAEAKEGGSAHPLEQLNPDLLQLAPEAKLLAQGELPARPLRESAQVMRIWIAPWIDSQDNLNWSGYVYTEVTPKRWSFGEQEVRQRGMSPSFIPR